MTGRESAFGLLFWVVERSKSYKHIALRDMDAPLCSARRTAWMAVSGDVQVVAAEPGALQVSHGLERTIRVRLAAESDRRAADRRICYLVWQGGMYLIVNNCAGSSALYTVARMVVALCIYALDTSKKVRCHDPSDLWYHETRFGHSLRSCDAMVDHSR